MKWIFKIFCFITLTFFSNVIGADNLLNIHDNKKFYVSSEDLLVCEHGLFLKGVDVMIPLTSIGSDEDGLYVNIVDTIRPGGARCLNGHDIYHEACNGCASWWCHFRCKCNSPW